VRGYRTVVAVLLVLAVLLAALLASCGASGDPFAFRAAPFFAEISGAVDGEHVEARLYLDLTEHSTKEIYDVGCIEYRAPESLAGITVGLRSDGVLSARLGELRTEWDFAYLLEPYLTLLSIGEEYDSIVCGKDGNTTVSFRSSDGELTYRFSKDGNVLQIDGTWHSHTVNLTVLLLP
jgi:hypothetical protein